jgi:hypothetical protein
VQSLFPRALPGDINTIPRNLTPPEILWFCVRGYTSDPQRPVDFFNDKALKRDEFMSFDAGRLVGNPNRVATHNSQNMTPLPQGSDNSQRILTYVPLTTNTVDQRRPYVYFDCSREYAPQLQSYGSGNEVVRPYRAANRSFANSGKFQIVSAGLDDNYGAAIPQPNDLDNHKYFPDGINYSDADGDNLVNFSERNLENSKP